MILLRVIKTAKEKKKTAADEDEGMKNSSKKYRPKQTLRSMKREENGKFRKPFHQLKMSSFKNMIDIFFNLYENFPFNFPAHTRGKVLIFQSDFVEEKSGKILQTRKKRLTLTYGANFF